MKKILFITPDFYPSSTGFANACINLINSIIKYGNKKYEVHVFSDKPLNNNDEFKDCKVFRYENTSKTKIGNLLNEKNKAACIEKYVTKFGIDTIFFETNTFPFIEFRILKKFKDKCIVRIHSTADTEVPVFGKRKKIGSKIAINNMYSFMKNVPYILATSNYYIEFIKKHYLNNNVYTIWNEKAYGILYNTSTPVKYDEQKYINNHFLTMGKLSSNGLTQKGMVDLLKAVYYLKVKEFLPNDFLLTMVGTGEKLPYIKELINKYDLVRECRIIELATHDEVFELMQESKAIVLLSRYEGQSMFITESISMGKPIIITSNNGMGDMLIEGVNGFAVRTGDIEDAALALRRMIDLDSDEINKMGKESKKLYEEKFSPQKVYEQFDVLMTLKD